MKWALLCVVGLVVVFFVIGVANDDGGGGGTRSERIERECRREFAHMGQEAVGRCQIAASVRFLEEQDKSALDRAYNRAR